MLAYQQLQQDEKNIKLLKSYNVVLQQELDDGRISAQALVSLDTKDPDPHIAESIEKKLREATTSGRSSGVDTLDKVAKILLFANSIISPAVQASPPIALVWTGISILLPVSPYAAAIFERTFPTIQHRSTWCYHENV